MQSYVTQAENNGGGWVVLVIHSVCDGCDSLSVSVPRLTQFLDWLQPRASIGTVVKTQNEVMGGVTGPAPDTTPPGDDDQLQRQELPAESIPVCRVGHVVGHRRGLRGRHDPLHDGRERPSDTNGTTYTSPFSITATNTVKFSSTDKAGNREAVKSTQIKIRR